MKPTDKAFDKRVKELYKTHSVYDISKMEGIDMAPNTLIKHLKSLGVTIRSRGGANHKNRYLNDILQSPEAKAIYNDPGLNDAEKAIQLGCHRSTILNYRKFMETKHAKKRSRSKKVSE
jgi:hypothetical protein